MSKSRKGGVHPITMKKNKLRFKRGKPITATKKQVIYEDPTESRVKRYYESERRQFQERANRNLTKKRLRKMFDDYKKMPPPRFRISGTPQALSRRTQLLKSISPQVFQPSSHQRMFTTFIKTGATPQEAKKMIRKMRKKTQQGRGKKRITKRKKGNAKPEPRDPPQPPPLVHQNAAHGDALVPTLDWHQPQPNNPQ